MEISSSSDTDKMMGSASLYDRSVHSYTKWHIMTSQIMSKLLHPPHKMDPLKLASRVKQPHLTIQLQKYSQKIHGDSKCNHARTSSFPKSMLYRNCRKGAPVPHTVIEVSAEHDIAGAEEKKVLTQSQSTRDQKEHKSGRSSSRKGATSSFFTRHV